MIFVGATRIKQFLERKGYVFDGHVPQLNRHNNHEIKDKDVMTAGFPPEYRHLPSRTFLIKWEHDNRYTYGPPTKSIARMRDLFVGIKEIKNKEVTNK